LKIGTARYDPQLQPERHMLKEISEHPIRQHLENVQLYFLPASSVGATTCDLILVQVSQSSDKSRKPVYVRVGLMRLARRGERGSADKASSHAREVVII
jgi:hypothetical protein